MKLEIKPGDRRHMLVWKSRAVTGEWCVAAALNGVPITYAMRFETWRAAYDYAFFLMRQ